MGSLSLTLTILFGLLSIILSLILYFRSTHRKRLTFTYDLVELHARTHPQITILFEDKKIENLSRLRVVVWNSGNQEIRRSDIPSDASPSILLTGARVLSVAVVNASPDTQCTASQRDDKTVSIAFEFLNPKDYATLDVLYESVKSKPADIQFAARVIGGVSSESRRFVQPMGRMLWIGPIGVASGLCVGAFLGARVLREEIHLVPSGIDVGLGALLYILGLFVGLLFCSIVLYASVLNYRHSRLPRLARPAFRRYPAVEQGARASESPSTR
jgi:hypothetical protein